MEQDVEDSVAGSAEGARGFRILYQKMLPFPARPGLAVWSPQLDLIALVTTNENLLLYRMNGQRVWGIAHKLGNDVSVEKLQWRPDGKMLALGYSDGSTRIYDVNNGKAIHRIVSEVQEFGKVTCVGWVDNHSHAVITAHLPDTRSTECTPQALFDLDIGSMLPRLGVLPASSGAESTFTSKTTLDALINAVTKGGAGSHLDVLLIGEEGGKVLLNVFDSFLIGTMELSSLSHQLRPCSKLLRHTATSDLSTHSLLISEPVRNQECDRLLFSTMDILFIQEFGQYLFQLASTSTRVQALLRYMHETVTSLETEFKTMNDLARRYISIIEEDAEAAGSELELEFFEFLITGLPTSTLKEWLLNTLMDRGQKRWEKSSVTGYETIRRLIHENLIPTCERLTVLFCRLRGLARWKESGSPLGLEPDDFTRCLDVVSGMTLFAHEFLLKLNKELELYQAFATWIRHAIDYLATEINIDDKPQEDPQIDTLKVAEYVGSYMKESSLQPFFKRHTSPRLSEYKQGGESITELYSRKGSVEVPGLMELAEYLDELCQSVFSKPQQAMRQQLRVGKPVCIHNLQIDKLCMRMVDQDRRTPSAYMALYCDEDSMDHCLVLAKFDIEINGGLSSVSKVGCARVSFPTLGHILVDIQFVDDNIIILIIRHRDTRISELLTMNFSDVVYDHNFSCSNSSSSIFSYATELASQVMPIVSRRKFDNSWIPAYVLVNGREGRRVGCVIADDKMRYFVFDIDHEEEDEDELDEDDSMEVEE